MPASRHHWLWFPAIAAAFVLLVWSTGRRSVNGHAPLVVYVHGLCLFGFAAMAWRSVQTARIHWRRGYSVLERPESTLADH